jgi:hypothetical protein
LADNIRSTATRGASQSICGGCALAAISVPICVRLNGGRGVADGQPK